MFSWIQFSLNTSNIYLNLYLYCILNPIISKRHLVSRSNHLCLSIYAYRLHVIFFLSKIYSIDQYNIWFIYGLGSAEQ